MRQTDPLPVQKGNETILIVEDDMQVRNLIKEVLIKSGYSILEAVDGEDAISVFSENKDAIRSHYPRCHDAEKERERDLRCDTEGNP